MGETGTLIQDDHDGTPFKVRFKDGETKWYKESQVQNIGEFDAQHPLRMAGSGVLAARRLTVGRPTKNAVVRINARGERSGSLGVIIQDDHDEKPFKVRFADDVTKWYTESEVQWYGKAEVRTRGTNVGDDLQALACLATVVGGVVHFAGSRDVGGAALRAAAQGFVMSSVADFVAEELAVAGFSLAAAAVIGAETGMILGPAGMAVGAAGAVAVEVAAGLGLAEALGAADAFGVGPVGLAVGAAGAAVGGAGAAVGAAVGGAVAEVVAEHLALEAVGYAAASVLCTIM